MRHHVPRSPSRPNLEEGRRRIVYFADDDNTYHVQLFEMIRQVRRVGVWPVGFASGYLLERPLVGEDGRVFDFIAWSKSDRKFPLDMAAFAVNYRLIREKNASFSQKALPGHLETHFLEQILKSRVELEPLCLNCTQNTDEGIQFWIFDRFLSGIQKRKIQC